jgi:hypothetical protein
MTKQDYVDKVEDLTVEQIVEGIFNGIVTFEELKNTGEFDASKQKSAKKLLKEKDDDAFANVRTVTELQHYLTLFPSGNHISEALEKIEKIKNDEAAEEKKRKEKEKMIDEIKNDINKYTPDEIIGKLSVDVLEELCNELGIDAEIIRNYREPELIFNDIPQNKDEIPVGYTDVFFWGIPSSGKTCALSAIFNTMKKKYSMEAPDCDKKFGATYRDSLINMFKNDYGYLPSRTLPDRTQYMPFLLYNRGERNKRKISFFELSGEVFRYFYDIANNSQIVSNNDMDSITESFKTLDLLLNSKNQKIHFFFIDYNRETRGTADSSGLTQSNYLEAATTYFRDKNDIFKKKTDAVYIVITKSDEIRGNNKTEIVKNFLCENFGSFIDVLKNQCKRQSVDFRIKLFSIGDVYFKRVCKINREFSTDIIDSLLKRVKPVSDSNFKKFFNS